MDAASNRYDYLVIGAGPAGLQLAYFLERAGCNYVVLEAAQTAGSFFETQPRHRTLLSINKIHNRYPEADFNLRHDWNSLLSDDPNLLFKHYSETLFPHADDLVRYLRDFAEQTGVTIRYGTRVAEVRRDRADHFVVTTEAGEVMESRCVVVATGAVGEHLPTDIEGLEHATSYNSHPLDATHYTNQRVAIVGAGNSAFEVAEHLANSAAIIHLLTPRPVKHAWQSHFPGDLRAVNNNILDMHQLKSLHLTLGFRVRKLARKPDGSLRVWVEAECPHWSTPSTVRLELEYDAVIFCTGWSYVPNIFADDTTPERSPCGRYPVLSATWESSVEGLYFIGTSMAARDKKAASSFIHGFRYNVRTCFHLLENKYNAVPLGSGPTPLRSPEHLLSLAGHLIDRVSTSSGLYQMNAVLADVVVVKDGHYRFIEELPLAALPDRDDFRRADLVFATSLEYGFHKYPSTTQSTDVIVPSDVSNTDCAAYLHPVLRVFENGEQVDEYHLGESLIIRYDQHFTSSVFMEGFDKHYRRSNEHRIANFLDRRLSLLPEPLPEQPYPKEILDRTVFPWPKERIAEHEAKARAMVEDDDQRPCRYSS